MSAVPSEVSQIHTRLLKCALEVEDARAYWARVNDSQAPTAKRAFDEYWFGARSLPRIEVLLANMRARFDAFPEALPVLRQWAEMVPDTRRVICHWHLQLSDPLYRAFTGQFLVDRRDSLRPEVTRDIVIKWVAQQGPGRWTAATRIQFASKLLSAAHSAGIVATIRDPRRLSVPRVEDDALAYFVHLLRGVRFEGTSLANPYLASVGLEGPTLESRLRGLDSLRFTRQGDLVDFGYRYHSLREWADAHFGRSDGPSGGHR